MARNVIMFTVSGSRGEWTHELPARFEVCDRCEGHGTHLHPDIGGHAYSVEEFRESFDEEEAEEYFTRGGRYDVSCEECHGDRVVLVVDEDAANQTLRGRRLLALYHHVTEREARWRAEAAHEARMERRMMGDWD